MNTMFEAITMLDINSISLSYYHSIAMTMGIYILLDKKLKQTNKHKTHTPKKKPTLPYYSKHHLHFYKFIAENPDYLS